MKTFDAIVVGSGQGGVPLAVNFARLGRRVALIEEGQLGGSCINYGCTPTKTMIASARIADAVRRGPQFGVHAGKAKIDMAEIVARKNEISGSFRSGIEHQVNNNANIALYRGRGRFTGPHTVEVNGETLASFSPFTSTSCGPMKRPRPR